MHANEDIPLPVLILWWLEVWLGLCKREPDPHVRYFPISDLGSSHFKFDLAAGLCKPGRLFQSPWKLNLSLKKTQPEHSLPSRFLAGSCPDRDPRRRGWARAGLVRCSPGAAPCSQLGVCIPHGVGGIWEKLNVRKPVHCCAAASPERCCI